MAALLLCASWFPPSAVAVASLGRRGPSPPPIVRIQARTHASHLRWRPKAADRDHHGLEPQPKKPKPERGDDEPDAAARTEIPSASKSYDIPRIMEQREIRKAFYAARRLREAPDMFRIEKDEISNYMNCMMIPCRANNFQDMWHKGVALFVCAEAQEALDLASMVMDLTHIESSHHDTIQLFDQHTSNQVIRMCTPIFCDVAKAAYLKRIEKDAVFSFLDALRGLAAFCDTLFQQMVFKLKDGPLRNNVSITMGTHSRNFDKKMKSLKEQFIQTMDARGSKHMAVIETLSDGMKHTQSYILQMISYILQMTPHCGPSLTRKSECSSES